MLDNSEKYYIAEILDEDLDVTEKWLIKTSIIYVDENGLICDEYEDGFVSRKMVFELIRKVVNEKELLELGFEISKLPLYLPITEQLLLKEYGWFVKTIPGGGVHGGV